MTADQTDSATEVGVVVNDEGQYSIWPTYRVPPMGWTWEGTRGTEDECLGHIETVWTDMTPRSRRPRSQQ